MKLILFLIITAVHANFITISDIHYDQYYAENSPAKCLLESTGLRCCHNWSIPLNTTKYAQSLGSIGCDSPASLVENIVNFIKDLQADFIVYLGDSVDHDLLIQNSAYNSKEMNYVNSLLSSIETPVFFVYGNHDSYLVDNLWDNNIGKEWLQNFSSLYKEYGFYSLEKDGKLLIFINSLTFDTHNLEVIENPNKDLFNQTTWFLSEISKGIENNMIIYIFSHFGYQTGEATKQFNSLLGNLSYEKLYFFAGHSHDDEIRLSNSTVFYINPSVVPDGHFPEVRLYIEGDFRSTGDDKIEDYIQYGFNLTSLQYEIVYTALSSYNLPDLSYESWKNFMSQLSYNNTLYNLYIYHQNWGNSS